MATVWPSETSTDSNSTNNSSSEESSPSQQQKNKLQEEEIPALQRLENASQDCSEVYQLDLSTKTRKNAKLTDNDMIKICRFTNVIELNLSGNEIKEFPDGICNLTKLEKLILSKNALEKIPKNVLNIPNIKELSVRLNRMKEWPVELYKLPLVKLDLAFNEIPQIKSDGSKSSTRSRILGGGASTGQAPTAPLFQSLKALDLSFNQFTQFPLKVLDFLNLEELDLSYNKFGDVPPQLAKTAETLKVLKLEKCEFTYFPLSICELFNLQILSLRDNKIAKLPPAIGKLNMLISLRELYLDNCELSGWSQLYCQAKLKILHLTNNHIFGFPAEIKALACLEELKLNKNEITDVPFHIEQFQSLRILDLSDNHIEDIDANIGKLSQLQILNLKNNQITELPSEFSELSNLIELNICNNKLRKLPSMSKFTKLQLLLASDNVLEEIPSGIGNCSKLEKVDFTMNRISSIPIEFYNCSKLQFVRLKHNAIEELHPQIQQLKLMEELNLDNNELVQLPEEICKCSSLKKLFLNYNVGDYTPSNSIQQWIKDSGIEFESKFEFADKIVDGVFIGSANAATNKKLMKKLGVTHILTVANEVPARHINDFKYMLIYVDDSKNTSLKPHFKQAYDFIEEGRKCGGTMIHCMAGRSRSATMALAYLMQYKNLRVKQAFQLLRRARPEVAPNDKFKLELKEFDKEMFESEANSNPNNGNPSLNRVEIIDNVKLVANSAFPSSNSGTESTTSSTMQLPIHIEQVQQSNTTVNSNSEEHLPTRRRGVSTTPRGVLNIFTSSSESMDMQSSKSESANSENDESESVAPPQTRPHRP